jgi:predicted TIM-barrel fold metal-dependent hydrolase
VIVDVHAHVAYPELGKRYPIPPNLLDIDGMIERKAAAGIDVTIVGSPTGAETFMAVPGVDPFAQPVEGLARHHDWLAQLVADHGGRLAAYAFVNPFGGSRMLDQVAADVRGGGFVGLIVNTSVEGRYLSDPEADDFFAMAEELGVPLFLHPPVRPVGTESLTDMRVVEQVLRFVEVSTALAAMMFAGRFERYPGLRVLAATAGGALGILVGRLEAAFNQPTPPWPLTAGAARGRLRRYREPERAAPARQPRAARRRSPAVRNRLAAVPDPSRGVRAEHPRAADRGAGAGGDSRRERRPAVRPQGRERLARSPD